jgi:hypothetical protein
VDGVADTALLGRHSAQGSGLGRRRSAIRASARSPTARPGTGAARRRMARPAWRRDGRGSPPARRLERGLPLVGEVRQDVGHLGVRGSEAVELSGAGATASSCQ